ncbi:ArsR/SmtB family transcription factor [Streptomyces sp. NPDC059063]|uniref:ArsR/SmtB family transcription factor n=1 Tax=unclassified Streptomyces TaxID=2593676 RepID=UPI0036AEBDB1
MDEVFKALADGSRRRLLDSLNVRNGQTLRELCSGLDMARQSVSKHLALLEAANLVTTVRRGREKLHYLNAEPINAIADRWISHYDRARVHALADLKHALESSPMTSKDSTDSADRVDGNAFVYTTYIKTTPQKLWQALTEPAFTRRYWNLEFVTDWQPGSVMAWEGHGLTGADPEQVVLESDPYRRLSYTWHTFTPAFAKAVELDEATLAKIAAEPRTKVSFDIEPLGETVKLTVVHDGFEPGSTLRAMIDEGWTLLISGLKTLLETGDTLPDPEEKKG